MIFIIMMIDIGNVVVNVKMGLDTSIFMRGEERERNVRDNELSHHR